MLLMLKLHHLHKNNKICFYAKLFEEWFGGNIDNKVFESAITFWFKDVDFDGDKVWEYFHMNN